MDEIRESADRPQHSLLLSRSMAQAALVLASMPAIGPLDGGGEGEAVADSDELPLADGVREGDRDTLADGLLDGVTTWTGVRTVPPITPFPNWPSVFDPQQYTV